MTTTPDPSTYDNSALMAEDEGYHKGLKPRQLQMIAIGGAIGTGLFLVRAADYTTPDRACSELCVLRHLRVPDPAGAG